MRFVCILFISLLLTACATPPLIQEHSQQKHLPIIQSLTTQNESLLIVLRPQKHKYTYQVFNGEEKKRISPREHFVSANKNWALDHLWIDQLDHKQQYRLIVLKDKKPIDERYFSSLGTKKKAPKIAVASCMHEEMTEVSHKIWPQLISQKPDAVFLIGDNVYADVRKGNFLKPTENTLWERHIEARLRLPYFQSKTLIPTFSVWDDHDYGANNGGIEFEHKNTSAQIYKNFFGYPTNSNSSFLTGPGLAFSFEAFKQRFVFLDNRSFRTKNKKDIPSQSHYGPQQEQWLFKQLNTAKKPTWLIQGDQFFGAYHRFESYEGSHPKSFKRFLKKLRRAKSPVWFLSGDRHLFEFMSIGWPDLSYRSYELTTSGIHAKMYPSSWGKTPNPRQIYGAAEKYNYALLQPRTFKKQLRVNVKAYTLNEKLLFERNIRIKK